MKPKTPISSAESALEAVQSTWSNALILSSVAWLGVVAGVWLSRNEFDIWAGNPLYWLYCQFLALRCGWGYIFLALQVLAFYVWMFTESCRTLSLATSFIANGLQIIIVYKSLKVDPDWLVCIGLVSLICLGTYAGWFAYRSILKRRK